MWVSWITQYSKVSLPLTASFIGSFLQNPSLAQTPIPAVPVTAISLAPVIVTAPSNLSSASLLTSPLGAGQSWQFDADDLLETVSDGIESFLSRSGIASPDAGSSLGLAPSLGMRGFAVSAQATPGLTASRLYLNGHADIAYRFVRDLSTVESVEVMGGFDSTLLGVGAPGGTLQFFSKQARAKEATNLTLTAANDGLLRSTIDIEKHFDGLQVRAVVAAQAGQRTAENSPTNRENYLLSFTLPSALGEFKFDAERQANHAPYVFGTIHANGRFEFDKPYVSPQSQALRIYERQSFYWRKQLGQSTQLSVSAQQAHVNRRETIVGFWDIKNASELNGYWRELDATAKQKDADLRLDTVTTLFGQRHKLTAAVQHHRQALNFSGPQSISQFSINFANPVWPVDLSKLKLTPRTLQENYNENGLAVTDQVEIVSGLKVQVGARRSFINLTTASNTPLPKTVAKFSHSTYAGALSWQVSPDYKLWLSNATSFEPNRGQFSSGNFLPPRLGKQKEVGVAYAISGYRWSAALFDIQQSNVANTDPQDRNFQVLAGTARIRGLSITTGFKHQGFLVEANATFQRGKARDLGSPSQGDLLVGQPQWLGGGRVAGSISATTSWWVNPHWSGQRPADTQGALYAPAFIRWDVGLIHKLSTTSTLAVQVDNLFDKRYVQAISSEDNVWQGPRRRFSIQITQSF